MSNLLKQFWMPPIMGYHRIGESKADHVPTVSVAVFERQLEFLRRGGYRVCRLAEFVESWSRRAGLPRKSLAITFDDGYEEVCTIAAPRLRRFGFPATVFVTPSEVGLPGFMTWEQLRNISRDGIEIGSHTLRHTYLPLASREQVDEELRESKRVLEAQLGVAIDLLSYPVGGFTPAIQDIARRAGYRAACTTNRGTSRRLHDLFSLRRIKMTDRNQHSLVLAVKLSGYYDLFRRLEAPA